MKNTQNKLYINIRYHIYININRYTLIISLIYFSYLLLNPAISLFDPGNEYTSNSVKELDGKPINYEPYRPGLQETREGYRYEMDGRPTTNYEPYRPGLQQTGNGYRYEMDGTSYPQEIGGRAVNYHPESHDVSRNVNYNEFYRSDNASTELGVVGYPTNSEYFPDEYLRAKHYTEGPAKSPSLFSIAKKFVKNDLEKTREKAREGLSKSMEKDSFITKTRLENNRIARANKLRGYEEMARKHQEKRISSRKRWG